MDGQGIPFTSQVFILCFLSPVLSFYGYSFFCGVVVSGGEGVQRKVVVGKAARFSCTSPLGGVSWDVLPSVLKRMSFWEDTSKNRGNIKTCGLQKRERKPCELPVLAPDLAISTTWAHVCWKSRRGGCVLTLCIWGKYFLEIVIIVIIIFCWKWVFPHWNSALQRYEPGASRPPPGTSKLALCVWDVNNNNTVISLLIQWSTKIKQMNVDCRLHLWKMKIFTRTCVARTQDHVI